MVDDSRATLSNSSPEDCHWLRTFVGLYLIFVGYFSYSSFDQVAKNKSCTFVSIRAVSSRVSLLF